MFDGEFITITVAMRNGCIEVRRGSIGRKYSLDLSSSY